MSEEPKTVSNKQTPLASTHTPESDTAEQDAPAITVAAAPAEGHLEDDLLVMVETINEGKKA